MRRRSQGGDEPGSLQALLGESDQETERKRGFEEYRPCELCQVEDVIVQVLKV